MHVILLILGICTYNFERQKKKQQTSSEIRCHLAKTCLILEQALRALCQRKSVFLFYSDEMCRLHGKGRVLVFLVQLALLLSF